MPASEGQVRTVIVVGGTGSGKSEVIKRLGGKHVGTDEPPETSAGLGSCAREWATYDIGKYDDFDYHLIDSVGLMDTNRDDEEAVEKIAKFLQQPTTVVGVIYVVAGRMSPPEMEICNFLFDTLFHDLDPNQLLVLRTKYDEWESYNAEREKDYLKQQNGIPERILKAHFLAVDFHPAYRPEEIEKMTCAILSRIKLWTTNVPLSRQAEAKFVSSYRRLEDCRQKLKEDIEERNAFIDENMRLEEQIQVINGGGGNSANRPGRNIGKTFLAPVRGIAKVVARLTGSATKNFFRPLGRILMSARYKKLILVVLMGFVVVVVVQPHTDYPTTGYPDDAIIRTN